MCCRKFHSINTILHLDKVDIVQWNFKTCQTVHFGKINKKLSKCKPALDLLYLSGFQKSDNNKRLTWSNTNNNNDIILLNRIHNELKSMTSNDNDNKIGSNLSKQAVAVPNQTKQRMQQVCHKK